MDRVVVVMVVITLLTKPVVLVDFIPGLQPAVLLAVLTFIGWALLSGRFRKRPIPPVFLLAFAITVLGYFSLIYSIDPLLGFRQLASTFPLRPLFFLCLLLWMDSVERARLVMKTIFGCGVVFALHGFVQAVASLSGLIPGVGDFGVLGRVQSTSIGIMSIVSPDDAGALGFVFPRVQSFFSEPAFYLGFLNVCLFLGLSLGLTSQKKSRRRWYAAGALLIVGVAPLTMSTAGVFSLVAGLTLYTGLLYSVPDFRSGVRLAGVAAVLIAAAALPMALRSPVGQMVYQYTVFERFSGSSGSVSDRARGFGLARDIIQTNPLGGVGFGNEQVAAIASVGHASGQYSSHLISFIQMGIGGFLLHVGITLAVFLCFFQSFRSLRHLERVSRDYFYVLLLGPFVAFVTLSGHGVLIPNSWWYIQWYVYVVAYALQSRIRTQRTAGYLSSQA